MRYTSIDAMMQPIEDTYRQSRGLPVMNPKLYNEPTETDPGCFTAEGEAKVQDVYLRMLEDKNYPDDLQKRIKTRVELYKKPGLYRDLTPAKLHAKAFLEVIWDAATEHVLNDGD